MKRPVLLSLPLATLGCLAGHAAGYAAVGASREDAAVHGYMAHAPEVLAACAAFVALALALRVSGRLRGRPSPVIFAVLPPFAFLAQELIERLAAGLPAGAVLEPAVLAGLVAQLPIAFLTYLAARALLGVADSAGRAFALRPALALGGEAPFLRVPSGSPPATPLAPDRLGRAPPAR